MENNEVISVVPRVDSVDAIASLVPAQFPMVPADQWGVFKVFLRIAITKEYPTIAVIEELEGELLRLDQIECPTTHNFSGGVYIREATMEKGLFVIGHQHKHEHFNIALVGRASVWMNGAVHEIKAPCVIKSDPMVKKMFLVHETLVWATVHATTETDVSRIEEDIFIKSEAYKRSEKKA